MAREKNLVGRNIPGLRDMNFNVMKYSGLKFVNQKQNDMGSS